MKAIFSDHKKIIKISQLIDFNIQSKGVYLIQVSAKTKDEKQLSADRTPTLNTIIFLPL